jgi:cell division protein FtsB
MRILFVALVGLLALIQYPLWLGKGGWLRAWDLDRQLVQQRTINASLSARNDALAAEVSDLRAGGDAVEERGRYELGMIRAGEVFVQVNETAIGGAPSGREIRTAATRLD